MVVLLLLLTLLQPAEALPVSPQDPPLTKKLINPKDSKAVQQMWRAMVQEKMQHINKAKNGSTPDSFHTPVFGGSQTNEPHIAAAKEVATVVVRGAGGSLSNLASMSRDSFSTAIWVEDQDRQIVHYHSLQPTDPAPTTNFYLPQSATSLTPFQYHNKLGLWQGPTISLPNPNASQWCNQSDFETPPTAGSEPGGVPEDCSGPAGTKCSPKDAAAATMESNNFGAVKREYGALLDQEPRNVLVKGGATLETLKQGEEQPEDDAQEDEALQALYLHNVAPKQSIGHGGATFSF